MLVKEIEKKLTHAQKQLNATMRRIRRLATAQKNWERQLRYYGDQLIEKRAQQEAVRIHAEVAPLMLTTAVGRKFR